MSARRRPTVPSVACPARHFDIGRHAGQPSRPIYTTGMCRTDRACRLHRGGACLCALIVAGCTEAAQRASHFPVGDGPGVVIALDLDGDRKLDLVVANE